MLVDDLKPAIDAALAAEVQLHPRGDREAQLQVPFYFADGDGYVIYLRQVGDAYELTDKAHTLQHLAYHLDISKLRDGTRAALLEQIQRRHGVEDRGGELVRNVPGRDDLGDAVFAFVQALGQISDLRMLEREIVRSTFREDLEITIRNSFADAHTDYTDAQHDPDEKYPIDWLLNGVSRPLAIFGLPSDEMALRAVVTARQFRDWGRPMRFIAVAEEQEKLARRTVAWVSDTFDKQFSTLKGNEELITEYLRAERVLAERLDRVV